VITVTAVVYSATSLYVTRIVGNRKRVKEIQDEMNRISNMLRKSGCTSILISEVLTDNTESLSRFNVEEFVADGVVLLHNTLVSDEYRRGISIWKMRSTEHSKKIHPYRITNEGFVIYPDDAFIGRSR
jgi:KaiC/GvpD/RAD55 family RecA-like ATPase